MGFCDVAKCQNNFIKSKLQQFAYKWWSNFIITNLWNNGIFCIYQKIVSVMTPCWFSSETWYPVRFYLGMISLSVFIQHLLYTHTHKSLLIASQSLFFDGKIFWFTSNTGYIPHSLFWTGEPFPKHKQTTVCTWPKSEIYILSIKIFRSILFLKCMLSCLFLMTFVDT